MKRPGDTTPERRGGRALQRLRQLQQSRFGTSAKAPSSSQPPTGKRGATKKKKTRKRPR